MAGSYVKARKKATPSSASLPKKEKQRKRTRRELEDMLAEAFKGAIKELHSKRLENLQLKLKDVQRLCAEKSLRLAEVQEERDNLLHDVKKANLNEQRLSDMLAHARKVPSDSEKRELRTLGARVTELQSRNSALETALSQRDGHQQKTGRMLSDANKKVDELNQKLLKEGTEHAKTKARCDEYLRRLYADSSPTVVRTHGTRGSENHPEATAAVEKVLAKVEERIADGSMKEFVYMDSKEDIQKIAELVKEAV